MATIVERKPATFQNLVRFFGDRGLVSKVSQSETGTPQVLERIVVVPSIWQLRLEEHFGNPNRYDEKGARYEVPVNGHQEVNYVKYVREPF